MRWRHRIRSDRLGFRVAIVLGSLAALSIISFVSTLVVSATQRNDTQYVNISGRQRMLSEQLARLSYQFASERDGERQAVRSRIEVAREQFESSLKTLRHGGTLLQGGELHDVPRSGDPAAEAALDVLAARWSTYHTHLISLLKSGPDSQAQASALTAISAQVGAVRDAAHDATGAFEAASNRHTRQLLLAQGLFAALGVAAALGADWAFRRWVLRPVSRLLRVASNLRRGRLGRSGTARSHENRNSFGEFALLDEHLHRLEERLEGLNHEAERLLNAVSRGELDVRASPVGQQGCWRELLLRTNGMVDLFVSPLRKAVAALEGIANGAPVTAEDESLPGELDRIGTAILQCVVVIDSVLDRTRARLDETREGRFRSKVGPDHGPHYEGRWLRLVTDIEALAGSIVRPLDEASRVSQAMARGDLRERMDETLPGRFGELAGDVNRAQDELSSMIEAVRRSTNVIAAELMDISFSNAELSERAQSQAAATHQVNSTVNDMRTTTLDQGEGTREASRLSDGACQLAEQGGKALSEAIAAIQSAREGSQRVEGIIQVIDEIAFQTNLLALNAAVEAARAGEQGKSFAVVASEVRRLAERSKDAALEIRHLIDTSIGDVRTGTELVTDSGQVLERLLQSVHEIGTANRRVSDAGEHQHSAIEQLTGASRELDHTAQEIAGFVTNVVRHSEEVNERALELAKAVETFRTPLSYKPRSAAPSAPNEDAPPPEPSGG